MGRKCSECSATWNHTGITCKKTLVMCATQVAGGLLLKKLKYFKVMLNIFNSPGCEKM